MSPRTARPARHSVGEFVLPLRTDATAAIGTAEEKRTAPPHLSSQAYVVVLASFRFIFCFVVSFVAGLVCFVVGFGWIMIPRIATTNTTQTPTGTTMMIHFMMISMMATKVLVLFNICYMNAVLMRMFSCEMPTNSS